MAKSGRPSQGNDHYSERGSNRSALNPRFGVRFCYMKEKRRQPNSGAQIDRGE
jgi:hypothetical protein